MCYSTGYFGVPGSSRGRFTVHVIETYGRTLCGWRPRKEMEYQWCAAGIQWNYIECKSCKKVAYNILKRGRK